ncbi:hypothetical protein Tco_0777189 [Tanacetum coccineum]
MAILRLPSTSKVDESSNKDSSTEINGDGQTGLSLLSTATQVSAKSSNFHRVPFYPTDIKMRTTSLSFGRIRPSTAAAAAGKAAAVVVVPRGGAGDESDHVWDEDDGGCDWKDGRGAIDILGRIARLKTAGDQIRGRNSVGDG